MNLGLLILKRMRVRIFKILKMINRAGHSQCFTDYKSKDVKKTARHLTTRVREGTSLQDRGYLYL